VSATIRPQGAPERCFWELTRDCDHRCLHCRCHGGKAGDDELSTAEALRVAGELAALGVRAVVLTGGEPTLRPDWEQVAGALAGGGLKVRLFTGGRSLDGRLLGRALDAGVGDIAISLDGPRAIHDLLRPTSGFMSGSSHDLAVAAIRTVVGAGVPLRVVTQANRLNMPHLDRIYETVRDLGVTRWQLSLMQATGRAREHLNQLMPRPEELERIVAVLRRAAREGVVRAPMSCTVGYLTVEEPVLRRRSSATRLVWDGTPAGLRTVGITANGGVLGCTCLPDEFVTASVRERSLADIWADDACFPYSRGWAKDLLAGGCADCKLARVCRAGCPAVAYGATGAIGANPFCLREVRREG
jgi:radical SAM protein with 4Fe4S-binding SPASM domain